MGQDLRDRPETQTSQVSVRTLLARVLDGTIAPCSFARPYVWKPAQMLALLEAVGRGMPVGALVLWEGCTPEWLGAHLGPLRLPAPRPWALAREAVRASSRPVHWRVSGMKTGTALSPKWSMSSSAS